MSVVTSPNQLYKQPSELRTYSMDFANLLASGETISSITSVDSIIQGSTTASDLTIASKIISGTTIQFSVAGGTSKRTYRIEVLIVTSLANILEGDGLLVVTDT